MESNHPDWEQEEDHLEQILNLIRVQLDALTEQGKQREQVLMTARAEMLERGTYDIGGLYSTQGFLDLMELSQAAQPIIDATVAQGFDEQAMKTLTQMMEVPYFARIDFKFEGEAKADPVYIGRATLMEKDGLMIHVYDWRTPIASVFYRYGVGSASYTAPMGNIKGEVHLKRQYEIQRGKLIYYFDADVQVMDAFLRELLSRPTSGFMKAIVETIQRDQDLAIRNMESDLVMVQGVAGSGKTSVALHRIAYLMYQGLAEKRLASHDIMILSPNAVFERYISHVLPELGERQVETALFEELFRKILAGIQIQTRGEWVDEWLNCQDAALKEKMRRVRTFKGSRAFVILLDRLERELPRRWMPFVDIDYAGQQVASGHLSKVKICNAKKHSPLGIRLQWLEREIFERVHVLQPDRFGKLLEFARCLPTHALELNSYARMLSIMESGKLLEQVRTFTCVDTAVVYRALFSSAEAVQRLGRGLATSEELEEVRQFTFEMLSGRVWSYQDAVALAYLEERVNNHAFFAHIRQVVIDEAQDVDELHMVLINCLFPKARFTVLGDVHQTLTGRATLSFYEKTRRALRKQSSTFVMLDKSFRCTKNIWNFSTGILHEESVGQCFSRSGEAPRIHVEMNNAIMETRLVETALDCREKGFLSVALVCKTEKHAQHVHKRLRNLLPLRLVAEGAASEMEGIFVIPLYIAKGLEFDSVLVCDADAAHYREPEDRNLLYVACTRALHRLELFCVGKPSPLLPILKEEK